MIVIAKDAEIKLMEELQRTYVENPKQACFYLEFSKANTKKKKLFEQFFTHLHAAPNAYMAQIYICQDTDIFIFMQGFMQRQFKQILQNIAAGAGLENIESLSHVFEIGHDWFTLKNICQSKLDKILQHALLQQEIQDSALKEKLKEKILVDTMASLDRGLIDDLSVRRNMRLNPAVLIVDDDQLSRTLAGNVLREHFTPYFAKDGKSALREFVSCAPDVVFLDIGMPDMNGHEVLQCLFQIDPNVYVIMFSGRKDKENMIRAFETGAQGFIGKPFTREDLYHHTELSPYVLAKKSSGTKKELSGNT